MGALLKQLGFYALHEMIGAAGSLAVYTATDARTQRNMLLYVLDALAEPDAEVVSHFVRSGEAAQRLQHDHILAIHERGEIDRRYYVAAEPPHGIALTQLLGQKDRRLSLHDRMAIVRQIATALEHADANGCLHGALTPNVVWVDSRLRVQISMFAILQAFADEQHTITAYSAPEQLLGHAPISVRTDVYSLSAIAYHLLVGQPPFRADDPAILPLQVKYMPPIPPHSIRPDMPAPLVAVLTFGLAKDPFARYGTAGEFAAALYQAETQAANAARMHSSTIRKTGQLRQLLTTLSQRSLTTLNALKIPGF